MPIRRRKPNPKGLRPKRKWHQCGEGGRKPDWVLVLGSGKQPCLGLKLPHLGASMYLFLPGLWTSAMSTCPAYSIFPATNSQ